MLDGMLELFQEIHRAVAIHYQVGCQGILRGADGPYVNVVKVLDPFDAIDDLFDLADLDAFRHDRLQPALLDRLRNDPPEGDADARVMTKQELRAAVLRDLSWLLNSVQPLSSVAERYPIAADSVLNYGLPPISGQLASRIDVGQLERHIRDAMLRFEPRILADTLEVRALEFDNVLETHNVIEFEIRGFLWAQPVPLELLLRTQLDLEIGQVVIRDGFAR